MDRLTSILEEFVDLRFPVDRRDQLDPAISDGDDGHFNALSLEALSAAGAQSEPPFVDGDRLVEITNGDPHVIDAAQHGLILGAN